MQGSHRIAGSSHVSPTAIGPPAPRSEPRCDAQLAERALLDLAHALGAHTEPVCKLTERPRRPVDTVVPADDRALAVGQDLEEARQLVQLEPPRHVLVRVLRSRIDEELSDAAHVSAIAVDRLVERAGP